MRNRTDRDFASAAGSASSAPATSLRASAGHDSICLRISFADPDVVRGALRPASSSRVHVTFQDLPSDVVSASEAPTEGSAAI